MTPFETQKNVSKAILSDTEFRNVFMTVRFTFIKGKINGYPNLCLKSVA